jgi:two-component system sensor histidine kinase YesM
MVEMFPNPPISPERKPVFLLDIEINQTELKHYLVQLMTYENGGSALLHGDWSLSNNIDERSFETIRQEIDRSFSVHNETSAIRSITVDDRRYFAVYEYSAVLDSTLLVYIPEGSVLGPLLKLRVLFLTLAAAALFIVTFFSYRIYWVIHIPLSKLVRAFGKVMTGNLLVSVRHGRKDEFHYLYEQFNQMVERIRLLIHEVYEQKIRVQRSELKQLQSQISPHFLYNSFYMIHRMSTISDMDGIKRFTKYLSDYFQFITRSGNDELTLEQEVRHAQAYVEIQQFRFYNRIQVEFGELPEAIGGITVPRLIIQPLVENSYKYALESHTGEGRLRISFLVELDRLHVLVEDNGEHLTDLKLQERKELLRSRNRDLEEVTALINIQRRIQIRFGEDWGLTLSRSEWGGMSVQLAIPIEQPKEEPDVSLDDNR